MSYCTVCIVFFSLVCRYVFFQENILLILIYEFLIAYLLKAIHFPLPPWGHSADSHLSLWTLMKFSEIFVYNFIINPKDSVVILFHSQINTLCSPCCAAFPPRAYLCSSGTSAVFLAAPAVLHP
jgi:energy-coupling factor transporter transmembrane protein EcfT